MATRFKLAAFRFGLPALFFLVLCVAGFLAAYRIGNKRGYADGLAKPDSEKVRPHAYFMGDLAKPNGPYSVNEIRKMLTNINPTSWESTGGPASLEVLYDRNGQPVFVITHEQEAHEAFGVLFAELRDGVSR